MTDPKASTTVRWQLLLEQSEQVVMALPVLRELLSGHGLYIVSEADQRVLKAAAALPEKQLQASLLGKPFRASHLQREFSQAELEARKTRTP